MRVNLPLPADSLYLPVLCSQSSNFNQPGNSYATATNKIQVASGGNTFVGYRNQKSFRFLGIPYADAPMDHRIREYELFAVGLEHI